MSKAGQGPSKGAPGAEHPISPQEVGHVVLRVRDLAVSVPFYELLGFTKVGGPGMASGGAASGGEAASATGTEASESVTSPASTVESFAEQPAATHRRSARGPLMHPSYTL